MCFPTEVANRVVTEVPKLDGGPDVLAAAEQTEDFSLGSPTMPSRQTACSTVVCAHIYYYN